MREPTYYILVALSGAESMHGYAIAQRAKELSDERVRITAGTLYGALDRLEKAGSIEVDRVEKVDGRQRRYYRIAKQGRSELADEIVRMKSALAAHATVTTSAASAIAGGLA